jgi:hypothetical protein
MKSTRLASVVGIVAVGGFIGWDHDGEAGIRRKAERGRMQAQDMDMASA